jgi:ketosteroid isomerase-like protein
MSQENVDVVRSAYDRFAITNQFVADNVRPDFVWDMSNFRGWPEQQIYEGIAGAERFLSEWIAAWDDWRIEIDALHDVDDKVVAIVRQHGRSKAAGMSVDMHFAQVWTLDGGEQTRMEMYSDANEALKAVGLAD